jgi:hypothetical protein
LNSNFSLLIDLLFPSSLFHEGVVHCKRPLQVQNCQQLEQVEKCLKYLQTFKHTWVHNITSFNSQVLMKNEDVYVLQLVPSFIYI